MNKHRVFISYYHRDDQYYRNLLERMNYDSWLFEDLSVGDGDIDDRYLTSEQIRREIRDNYINNATVLILLCGPNTRRRKHIDWEIHMAMTDYDNNSKMSVLVINLPNSNNRLMSNSDRERQLIGPGIYSWSNIDTAIDVEERMPDLPDRIKENILRDNVEVCAVNWNTIYNNKSILKELVDISYRRRRTQNYDISTPLRRNNS